MFESEVETEKTEQCPGYFGLPEFGDMATRASERARVIKYPDGVTLTPEKT